MMKLARKAYELRIRVAKDASVHAHHGVDGGDVSIVSDLVSIAH